MQLSKEDFDKIVNLIMTGDEESMPLMCTLVEDLYKFLSYRHLAHIGKQKLEDASDDIQQSVYVKIFNSVVLNFFKKEDFDINHEDAPKRFVNWLIKVMYNEIIDYFKKDRDMVDIDDSFIENQLVDPRNETLENEEHLECVEHLKKATSIVLSSNIGVYKVLTWMAHSIVMVGSDVTKKESNHMILSSFEHMTLNDMYKVILVASEKIPWLTLTEEQNERIIIALKKIFEGNMTYGETTYGTFFMKNNGEVSGLKSISDWINRINNIIRRKTEEVGNNKKNNPNQSGGKKRGADNEASHC